MVKLILIWNCDILFLKSNRLFVLFLVLLASVLLRSVFMYKLCNCLLFLFYFYHCSVCSCFLGSDY